MPIEITPHITIEDDELEWRYIRSPGPGGQNVNKVATGAVLRFNVFESEALPEGVRDRLMLLVANRITASGDIVIKAVRYRTQSSNKRDAMTRLQTLILAAVPPPKTRKKRKPTKAQKAKRVEKKRQRGQVKATRRFNPSKDT